MKAGIFALATALTLVAPLNARADVGEEEKSAPPVRRRVYTEHVQPAPFYREEVRVYRQVPVYETRIYREVPVYREIPVCRPPVYYVRPAPFFSFGVPHHFGPRVYFRF